MDIVVKPDLPAVFFFYFERETKRTKNILAGQDLVSAVFANYSI